MTAEINETPDNILAFWFGDGVTATEVGDSRKTMWWGKSDELDQEIRSRFHQVTQAVSEGRLEQWQDTARGLLASIICCDQFSRNMFRGTPESFAYDGMGLSLAKKMVTTGRDQELTPIQRVFAYLPFEHSEEIEMQEQSMILYKALLETAEPDDQELFANYLEFARRHWEIIKRFGRFPHRNEILGRESTTEEVEFLSTPNSSF